MNFNTTEITRAKWHSTQPAKTRVPCAQSLSGTEAVSPLDAPCLESTAHAISVKNG